jgi:hypothetical protein
MMQLPINEKELQYIIEVLQTKNPQLYNKLWSYKIKELGAKKNGLS